MKSSTKFITAMVVLFIVVLGGAAAVSEYAPEQNPFVAKEEYFVKVTDQFNVIHGKFKFDQDEEYTKYIYTLPGYNKDGQAKDIEFSAGKELRKDAYLKISIRADKVLSYEEVQAKDLPQTVAGKI